MTSSPDPSGIASAAILSSPACVMKSSPPLSVTTYFPTLVTMGGIAPADACPLPAILTKLRFYASHEGLDGSFMVNICSGERLWQPPVLDWDLEWDNGLIPNPGGTWYRVPGSRQWIQLDCITSWIHCPTDYRWYLVEDTAQPLQYARPLLPHQIDFILAKLTLHQMNHKKGGSVAPHQVLLVPAKPVESGRSLSPTRPHPMSYVGAVLSMIGGDCQPSSQDLQATTAHKSAAITLHRTACQCKWPRCCPGHCNGPRVPNPPDEAITSHPQPTMGKSSMPTMSNPTSVQANNGDPRSHLSPSLQPFTIASTASTYLGGRFDKSFHDCNVQRKCPQ